MYEGVATMISNLKSFVTVVLLACSSDALADVIISPPSLPPGTEYRLAFLTSGRRDALSSNIADYNAFVTLYANQSPSLAALNTTWTAIASTATVAARDNTNTNTINVGVPIYRLDGLSIALNNADLWDGSLSRALNIYENGSIDTFGGAYTGTDSSGAISPGRYLGSLPSHDDIGYVQGDSRESRLPYWINGGYSYGPGAGLSAKPLYAISGVLRTAVPEPNSLLILGLGLFSFAFARLRRT
jgi:PEP-CTERM motif